MPGQLPTVGALGFSAAASFSLLPSLFAFGSLSGKQVILPIIAVSFVACPGSPKDINSITTIVIRRGIASTKSVRLGDQARNKYRKEAYINMEHGRDDEGEGEGGALPFEFVLSCLLYGLFVCCLCSPLNRILA